MMSAVGHKTSAIGWCRLAGCLLSIMAGTALADEDYRIPARDIRESARRILSDPDFQSFDHFGEADVSAANGTTPQGSTFRDAAPKSSPFSNRNQTGRPTGRAEPGAQGQGQGTSNSGDTTSSSAGDSPDQGTTTDRPAPSASKSPTEPERPERYPTKSNSSGSPSLRGFDGVERPVRFAPKPKTAPKPPKWDWNWDFDLGLGEFFGSLGALLGGSLQILAYLVLAVVCGLIVFLAARAVAELLKSRRRGPKFSPTSVVPLADDRSPGELAADLYLQRAMELAEQGHYREALGQLILGAMSAIERQQWIRYRRGLTLHDYLRSVRSRPAQYQGLQTVAAVYEPVEYGRRMASADLFSQALDGYRAGFDQSPRL